MTTASAARHDTGLVAGGAGPNSGSWTATVRRAWNEYWAYTATVAELAALTDKELSDIGMRRDTLKQVARRAAYGI